MVDPNQHNFVGLFLPHHLVWPKVLSNLNLSSVFGLEKLNKTRYIQKKRGSLTPLHPCIPHLHPNPLTKCTYLINYSNENELCKLTPSTEMRSGHYFFFGPTFALTHALAPKPA